MNPTRLAKLESAMRVVLDFNRAFNNHDVTAMMGLVGDECIFESWAPAPDGTAYLGKEAVTQFWNDFFRESPQAHIEIEEIFGLGERCIMRWKYSWVDVNGEKGDFRGNDIFLVRDGTIREKFSYVKR